MNNIEPLIFAATSDLAGITRGKAFPISKRESRCKKGIGWTPTNAMITCFDTIAPSPFGSLGDLTLIPDVNTEVTLNFNDESPTERFMLGDITDLQGKPWGLCTRSILKAALKRLKECSGITLYGAFEHEFQFAGNPLAGPQGFSINGFSQRRAFGESLMSALKQGGLTTDTFMKEYGDNQYEVTNEPALGVRVADDAVILREVTRMTAKHHGETASFTPIRDPNGVGNGVHIHMSFLNDDKTPVTWDPKGSHGMSAVSASFVAGVLKYLDSIIAITAPSVVSYLRLTPHRWSAAYNNLGFRDREASVRICPVTSEDPKEIAKQYNFEFRAADAAASPYLALAAIIHAGCQGIEDDLPTPAVSEEDLSLLSEKELMGKGYTRLPQSLEEALQRFESNEVVCAWFPKEFSSIYVTHKKGEIEALKGMDELAICDAYEKIY